jgi:protein-S-isoprenylcysteine O-methyltransferase Ste14
VRHPRYLGIILFPAGIGLVFRSWIAIAHAVLSALVLTWRIRDEESLLSAEFGREWESCAERSRRLVPFVY